IFTHSSYDDEGAEADFTNLETVVNEIDEEVYVSQPPGFLDSKYPEKVYKVVKALYGLHQAPRAYKNSLVKHFEDMKLCRPFKEYLHVWFNPPRDESMSCLTIKGMHTIGVVCTSIPDTYIVHSLFEKVSTDRPKVSTDESKVSTNEQVEGTEDTDFEKVSTDRPKVSTDESKVSTDEQVEGTDESNESTEEIFEGTEDQREGTEDKVSTDEQMEGTEDQSKEENASKASQTSTQTPTSMTFGDDETIATLLINMSKAKAASKEKEKGVELKDVEEIDRPRPTSTRSLLTLKPLPTIDPKDKGKKKIEEEDESESEDDDIPQAVKKFKQLESDEVQKKISETKPHPPSSPTGEVPNESLPDSSFAQPSEVPYEQQPDPSPSPSPSPSPNPSPTPIVADSIPEPTGENLGDHSSNDASLSGNEDDMTPKRSILCPHLCKQVSDQAKEIKLLKAKINKLKKQAKPGAQRVCIQTREEESKRRIISSKGEGGWGGRSSVDVDPAYKIDHMESENAQMKGGQENMVDEDKDLMKKGLSTEDVVSTDKEGVSTDFEKVSTDRPIVSTDGSKVSIDEKVEGTEGTEEHSEGTEEHSEGTEEIFESIEEHREGTEEKFVSTAGQIKSTEDQTKEEIASQTSTQTPTSMTLVMNETIAYTLHNKSKAKSASKEKEKGVRLKIEEMIDSSCEEIKQLEIVEELARKIKKNGNRRKRNKIAEEQATNELSLKTLMIIKARIGQQKSSDKLPEQKESLGNFKHSELKSKKFEDIQAMYEKIKRSDEDFIAIGSVEDDRLITKMNKKDSSKRKIKPEESKKKSRRGLKKTRITRKRKHTKESRRGMSVGKPPHNKCYIQPWLNRHEEWLVPSKRLEVKDVFLKSVMFINLPKIVGFSTHPSHLGEEFASPRSKQFLGKRLLKSVDS
ncbi:uncharacterized mitochondrial protein-like protein, partial [Tanacetum coccineum]